MKEYSDIEIIECLRNRQSYVVHYLSARYLPMIRLMVTKMGGTSEDSKDIFQEGLMIMIEKIDDRNFMLTCRFKTFLYCVCKHLWESVIIKKQAANNYFARRVIDEDEKDIHDLIDSKIYEDILLESYESLDPVSKSILRLYWDEVSPQVIALRLGYTYGYVRKKKCEAQAEIVDRIKKHPKYIQLKFSDAHINKIVI
jgi:RNA polymerase sigma factor (sigma-70 family)